MWIAVRERFSTFCDNIKITSQQRADGLKKQRGIRKTLQRVYYDTPTTTLPGLIVGSWEQRTQIRPVSDIDIFFLLPDNIFYRINNRVGNKQSALLQEIKNHLIKTYPQTKMRGDGQVIQVSFNTIVVEIVPVFRYAPSTVKRNIQITLL